MLLVEVPDQSLQVAKLFICHPRLADKVSQEWRPRASKCFLNEFMHEGLEQLRFWHGSLVKKNAVRFFAGKMSLFPKPLHYVQNRGPDMSLGFAKMVRHLPNCQSRMVLDILEDFQFRASDILWFLHKRASGLTITVVRLVSTTFVVNIFISIFFSYPCGSPAVRPDGSSFANFSLQAQAKFFASSRLRCSCNPGHPWLKLFAAFRLRCSTPFSRLLVLFRGHSSPPPVSCNSLYFVVSMNRKVEPKLLFSSMVRNEERHNL